MSWGSHDQGPQTRDQKKQSLPSSSLEAGFQNQGVSTAAGKHPSLSLPAPGGSGVPWLVATSLQSVPLSAPGLSLCLFLTNFSLIRKPVTVDWGPRCSNTTSSLFMTAKTLFLSKVTFTGSGWTCVLGPPCSLP